MLLDKIQFRNGTIVPEEYLNEVQKGSSFSAPTSRDDYYSDPTNPEHLGWKIGQRDRLKDWEIADPRQDNETGVGRLAHDGIVLGWNETTQQVVQGPPTLVSTDGGYGVWVEAGSIVDSEGEPIFWSRDIVELIDSSESPVTYLYIDEQEAKKNIADGESVEISIGSNLPSISQPHIPLAKLTLSQSGTSLAQNEDGDVVGVGYIDLRPGVYVGNLNSYPRILRNTDFISDSYVAKSWERVIADTSNGSLIVQLPAQPTDSDRIAIVDISGTFDRFPIVIRPGEDTKINSSVDDWIINIKDAHIELFYHAATAEWKFEETPGGDCSPVLGAFLSCGGREFIGQRTPEECPDGATLPPVYPNPPDGVYRYEASTSKCYKEFYPSVAVYADGQGGLIKVQNTPRCDKVGFTAAPEVRNIIYVDPSIGDDSITNSGFSNEKPFRSIERAIIEAVRESRRSGQYNDRYDKVVIELAPGDYYIDNSPGSGSIPGLTASTGLIQRVDTGFKILDVVKADRAVIIQVDSLSPSSIQPPRALNLGRIIYSESGGVGNIAKIEKDNTSSSIWKVTLEYVRGSFSVNDEIYYDGLSLINPTGGGIIVPRGISINGVDLRKVRVRPMHVPELNPIEEEPQRERTNIFKVTGGTYISLITFTDNPQIHRSHNTVTSIGFASQGEIEGSSTETSYYSKLNSLFNQYDNWGDQGLEAISAETTIVAPIYDTKDLRQTDSEENQTGVPLSDSRSISTPAYPGATRISRRGSGDQRIFDLPDINSTRSSSPYVFNCSVRSIFGMNGLHADGALVAGFKSMVTANFTQVSLQTDPTCFTDGDYYLDPPTNKDTGVGKQYRTSTTDPFKYRHFGMKGSNNAVIQIVSVFVIGNADHFIAESGGDLSITNSCSDFGDISLHSVGYKTRSFSQDEGKPANSYRGTRITEIVPPKPLIQDDTLIDTDINTGLVIDYALTEDWYILNSPNENPPNIVRIYLRSSNNSAQFNSSTLVPSAQTMGFGQFSYTKQLSDGTYELSGGQSKPDRKRFYIRGIDESGNAVIYAGDIYPIQSPSTSPGFEFLNSSSKIFIWDQQKSCWYVNITTSNIVEGTRGDFLFKRFGEAFKYKIKLNTTGSETFYKTLDFLAPGSPLTTVRGVDRRKNEDRIYRVVFEGFNKDQGIRRPQNFYILEKQLGVSGYPLNGSSILQEDPLVISQIRDYDEVFDPQAYKDRLARKESGDGRFVAYLTQASQARKVASGELYPPVNFDEPELTEDPIASITREALVEMEKRPGVKLSEDIKPNINPIEIKVNASSTEQGFLVGLRRPSVIRASGHTWEWTGYLNYDTAFPTFQGEPLDQDFALGKIIVEKSGGKVYATGMNEEGSFYIGTTVFDLRTGEQFAIPLEADNEPGAVTNQVFNSVVIKSSLAMEDGAAMYFGNDTALYFDPTTTLNTITGPITATSTPLPEVYANDSKAGLVQLATTPVIRGALGKAGKGISDKVVVTAKQLAEEFNLRLDGSIIEGTGVYVQTQIFEGGDPTDPTDDIIKSLVGIGLPEKGDNVAFAGLRLGGHEDPAQLVDTISNAVVKTNARTRALITEKALRDYVINTDQIETGAVTGAKIASEDITFNGNITIGTTGAPKNLYVTNDIYAFYTSDKRLKDNITQISDALDKVSILSGNTFTWNELSGKSGTEAGVIAQEVKEVLPEAVVTRNTGYMAVKYDSLIPLLIEAIKELKQEVEELKKSK